MPTLAQIAEVVGGEVDGDGSIEITHACEITSGSTGGITFLADPKHDRDLASSPASAIILKADAESHGKPAIRVANPAKAFADALAFLYPEVPYLSGVHSSATLGRGVKLGREVCIGPCAVIGNEVTIGKGSIIEAGVSVGSGTTIGSRVRLHPNVVIYDGMRLGDEVIIHSGTIIGADGYGYVTEENVHHKIPQVGRVVIGNRVEIGANSAVDRSTIGDTIIGDGTKIDNLVHIAHNVKIGSGCLFAGMVGIAGSTTIGNFVTLAGQVGVADHLTIGDRVVVAAKAAVRQSIPAGRFYAGDPAVEHQKWLRQYGAIKQLPELTRRLRKLEASLARLEKAPQEEGD
ncbi:MAG: UDP-3-O-(3-hydroxymyristoyl)glucosamine N-acyltransferase [Fidelibacterota bacterium]|nr:MAG: UDP-3-O-(3-hydroxymyristoyl)glucosamine N-acyltransferase [Candidatus Neomarinimicrobiota bacterium]